MFTHEIAGKWIEYAYKKGLIKHDSFLKKWWREFKSEENEEKDYWN